MGSYMNFKNFVDTSQPDTSNGKAAVNFPLARQSSVYSLTFDELQNTLGGSGKDFGSMNMDELLKSIWTAEESQALANSNGGGFGNLQRQGSLTLPRTLSQKTVDEVWRDCLKETIGVNGVKDGSSSFGQREPTLSEMTLEEFLARAGVVKEETQPPPGGNPGFAIGFQEQPPSQNLGVLGNNQMVINSPNLGINMNGVNMIGVGSSSHQDIQQPQLLQPQIKPLFPKETTLAFSSSPITKGPVVAMSMGKSPGNHLSSHAMARTSNAETTPTLSPSPFNFGEVGRGRRSGPLEKVVERRRKRMIKNRESAARSRARKQAYTLELEAEIAKLKEMNQGLRRKQEEIEEMQKNEILETTNGPKGGKRICLRRTLTGPW